VTFAPGTLNTKILKRTRYIRSTTDRVKMETLRMRCMCLFAVTVMMIWGTDGCCMPAQWQWIEIVDIGADTNCTPSVTKVSLQYITINFFVYGCVVVTCVCYE